MSQMSIQGMQQMTRDELIELRRQHEDLDNHAAYVKAGRPCPAEEWPDDEECGVQGEKVTEWKPATVYGEQVRVRKVNGITQISMFAKREWHEDTPDGMSYGDASHGC